MRSFPVGLSLGIRHCPSSVASGSSHGFLPHDMLTLVYYFLEVQIYWRHHLSLAFERGGFEEVEMALHTQQTSKTPCVLQRARMRNIPLLDILDAYIAVVFDFKQF